MVFATPATLWAEDGPVALKLEGLPGFWVPRALFVEMEATYEDRPKLLEQMEAKKLEAKELRLSLDAKAETASTALERRDFFADAYGEEREARAQADADAKAAARRGFSEQPALWLAVGVLGALGIAWAAGELRGDPTIVIPK